jgi:hypothetical protein
MFMTVLFVLCRRSIRGASGELQAEPKVKNLAKIEG